MTRFYRGIAGRRPGKPKGAVIHNDAGSIYATIAFYMQWLNSTRPAENGFAHVYISSDGRYQLEDYLNMAWHTASYEGNTWYVGWEADQSMGDLGVFMRNEAAVLKDVAKFFIQFGITPNRETVRLHKEFSATTCPHRSWEIHGALINAVKDYFISEIKKYMGMAGDASETELPTILEEDNEMFIYWKGNKKGGSDAFFKNGNTRMYLGSMKLVEDIRKNLLQKYVKSDWNEDDEMHYGHDNFSVKTIELTTTEVKWK